MVSVLSCTRHKSFPSQEDKLSMDSINHYLELSRSDTLSSEKKLSYINQSCQLAKNTSIDSLILKAMNAKGEFLNLYYPDKALRFLKAFEQLASLKKDTLYLGYSFLNLGDYYSGKKQDSVAFSYYHKSKTQFEFKRDSSHVVYSLLTMSDILKNKDDYYDMEAVNTEALSFISQTNRNYNYCCVYNNLGISSKETFDYEKSLGYYKKARQYAEDELSRLVIDNNIASVSIFNKQYQKAIAILVPLQILGEFSVNLVSKARVLDNLGLAYYGTGDDRCLQYFQEALAIREKQKDEYGLIASYCNLSKYYKQRDLKLAKEYALKAYANATKIKSIDERLDALEILAGSSSGNESRAFSSTYFRLNDSIIRVRQKNKNQFAKIRYDFSNEREQNLKLKTKETEKNLELANSENQMLVLSILGVIGIVMVLFRFNQVKSKSKREKLLEVYNTETRISKQLHDELANDVYHAMTFAETQDLATENNKETLLNNLDNIYSRTRNISKENSAIETGVNFIPNLREMMANYSNQQVNVLVNGLDVLQTTTLENNKKIMVYRVIHELLVNMKKHSKCSLVVITFKKTDKKIQIDYSDNGVGAPLDKINSKNGLQNVENRIDAINGTITFDKTTNKGFKVSFTFPI